MNPLISICCTTYNHEKYIEDCINGFLSQQTSFLYEIIIHDDASTDKTPQIIQKFEEKYPEIIKPIYQSINQMSLTNANPILEFCLPRANGKYIAFCDGDDYWTDIHKLQDQVNVLETFPEISLCTGGVSKKYNDGKEEPLIESVRENYNTNGFFFTLLDTKRYWLIPSLTWVFRKKDLSIEDFKNFKSCRDIHRGHWLLKKGNGFYFTRPLGVYRIHSGGIHSGTSQKSQFDKDLEFRNEIFEEWHDKVARFKVIEALMNLSNYYFDRFHILNGSIKILEALAMCRDLESLVFIFKRTVRTNLTNQKQRKTII
jgi:glycosyltransferase involved in cell wall biosynthesis